MTRADVERLANQAARRAGFARATEIRYDARRLYGATVVKSAKGYRSRCGYVKTVCVVAVPGHWLDTKPETVTFPAPEFEYERKRPSESEKRRYSHFRRLARHNDFRTSYRIAYGTDPGDSVDKLLDEFIAKGVLIGPDPRTLPKPKAKYARGKGLFGPESV